MNIAIRLPLAESERVFWDAALPAKQLGLPQ
jgi:hypothetical protein